jgi:formylglycine-generating enzyme required for sulfatase activity
MKSLLLRLLVLSGLLAVAGCALWRPATTAKLPDVDVPGVVYIRDSLYIDETEVANIHWLEYLHFLQKDSSRAVYEAALPDTTLWNAYCLRLGVPTIDIYLQYYLRYPGFRYFPVVGVSQQQAEAYCRWRSAKVAEVRQTSPGRHYQRQRRRLRDYDVQVTYRLPTAAEWETSAMGRLDSGQHPYGYEHPPQQVNKHFRVKQRPDCLNAAVLPADAHYYLNDVNVLERLYYQTSPGQAPVYFNCEHLSADSLKKYLAASQNGLPGGAMVTDYIYSSKPNGYGLYNMIGNVAELTTTPGQAKGGSFEHTMAACRPATFQPYEGPQEWLGFRCACTVRVRRKASL